MTSTPPDRRSALTAFQAKHPKLHLADIPVIEHVLDELGIEFLTEATSGQYLHDPTDLVHINPTFVVSREPFAGSHRDETYTTYPWRRDLAGAAHRSDNVATAQHTGFPFCDLCADMAEEPHWTQDCPNQQGADT